MIVGVPRINSSLVCRSEVNNFMHYELICGLEARIFDCQARRNKHDLEIRILVRVTFLINKNGKDRA